jgi:two-component system, LuxR family, sensor kinase FixL
MRRIQIPGLAKQAAQFVVGAASLAAVTAAFFGFGFHVTSVALAYLIVIVVVCLFGSVIPALALIVVATGLLAFYFAAPIYSFGVASPEEAVALLVFVLAAFVMVAIVDRVKASETQLRERAHLLDLTHDTVFVRDMRDAITFWNRGAEDRYGWSSAEAIGNVTHQLLRTKFPAPLDAINTQLMATGRWEGELVHTRRDGTEVVVASRWALQRDPSGKPVAIMETNNDITDRKQVEEKLNKTQVELAHVNRVTTIGQLAASIAHEVNQPIAATITNANAALRFLNAQPPHLGEVRDALTEIANDGRRAGDVIGRIRALIRKVPPRYETMDVNQTILEVLALARTQMDSNGVALQTQLADGLPQVAADRVRIQQVMLNLIVNAIEAMSAVSGTARRLSVSTADDGAGGVHITVQDNGPGLTQQSLDQLFNAFYTTKPGGMGMGLAICQSIVEEHGGQLSASANAPEGAVFQFRLPPRPPLSETA